MIDLVCLHLDIDIYTVLTMFQRTMMQHMVRSLNECRKIVGSSILCLVYYREMALKAKNEFYSPKSGEVSY